MKKSAIKPKAAPRGHKIDYRVNDEEYAVTQANAEACGLTVSDYCRKVNIGYKPKCHLTEREIEAYKSLTDARGDIIKLMNALKGLSSEQRLEVFRGDVEFMRKWVDAVTVVLTQWDTIVEDMRN